MNDHAKQEFYESEIYRMARRISQLLDSGYSVEIARSCSGIKLCRISRKYEQVRNGGGNK